MSVLKLNNINNFYTLNKKDKVKVINDINIEFDKGELVSFVGESGSGKSTLMNIIGGLDSDYMGEILVEAF